MFEEKKLYLFKETVERERYKQKEKLFFLNGNLMKKNIKNQVSFFNNIAGIKISTDRYIIYLSYTSNNF